MTLPSVFLTEASNVPPPTSLTPWCASAGVEERLETLLDVVNVPVGDGTRRPLAVAVGIETEVLAFDVEADVVVLVHVGLHTHKPAVQRRSGVVYDGAVLSCARAHSQSSSQTHD